MDEAHRRIVTLTGAVGPGVPFRRASISAAMQNSLANTVLQQEKLISYLRGGNTYTDSVPVTTTDRGHEHRPVPQALRRARRHFERATGDRRSRQAHGPVRQPRAGARLLQATDPGYPAFATSIETRATRIVAPANDGMVHVFDAGPVQPAVAAGGGTEVFAFIPRALFRASRATSPPRT